MNATTQADRLTSDPSPSVAAEPDATAAVALVAVEEAALLQPDCVRAPTVALSADGNWAVIRGRGPDSATGSAHVFTRHGGTWAEHAVLVAADAEHNDFFAASLSITGDGSRVLVGVPGDRPSRSARLFVRTGASWVERARLADASGINFGKAVGISHDGTTAFVADISGHLEVRPTGWVRVFSEGDPEWREGGLLGPSNPEGGELFGYSIATSSDASRLVVGAVGDDRTGSARVLVRDGRGWTEEAILRPSGVEGQVGWSVATSSTGDRVVVGTPRADGMAGGARVYVRTASSWTEEAALSPAEAGARDLFGMNVALSGDGSRALVGGANGVRLFARAGTNWHEVLTLPANGDLARASNPGTALSSDGSRALVGSCVFRIEAAGR